MKSEFIKFHSHNNPYINFYNRLPKAERVVLDNFEKYCLISAGVERSAKFKSNAVRFLVMSERSLSKIDLEDLRDFLGLLKGSGFSDYSKNDIKGFVTRFLKWHFKDWSERFGDFEDVRYNSDAQRMEKIDSDDTLSKERVGELVKDNETSLYHKTFCIVQYEGALRTLECRKLKWDEIDMEDLDVYWLDVGSKKNKNGTEKRRTPPPLSQSIYFLNELKKQQEKYKIKSPYVFPSKRDPNNFISSGAISKWFSRLTKRVLGKSYKNYILRHSKGEELHKLVREGKLSKENAIQMMGHSEKMFDKTYSHADKREMKKLIKKQVLDVDFIAPEKKHKLEIELEEQKAKTNKAMGIILDIKDEMVIMKKDFRKIMKAKNSV